MNKWAVLGVVVLAALLGWGEGLREGEAERKSIIADMPEERAYWKGLEAKLSDPNDRELICEQIFDLVGDELTREYRLDVAEQHEVSEQLKP